ncbi:hypothetical protein [Rodentibacter rarus]|uniref:hypothetical protein n=1 Tax=Rodentibacter rarus TaxID=1908260 RepID=UPI0021184DE3|nr:hypothetical protein [Rodentibacter rarus]
MAIRAAKNSKIPPADSNLKNRCISDNTKISPKELKINTTQNNEGGNTTIFLFFEEKSRKSAVVFSDIFRPDLQCD